MDIGCDAFDRLINLPFPFCQLCLMHVINRFSQFVNITIESIYRLGKYDIDLFGTLCDMQTVDLLVCGN